MPFLRFVPWKGRQLNKPKEVYAVFKLSQSSLSTLQSALREALEKNPALLRLTLNAQGQTWFCETLCKVPFPESIAALVARAGCDAGDLARLAALEKIRIKGKERRKAKKDGDDERAASLPAEGEGGAASGSSVMSPGPSANVGTKGSQAAAHGQQQHGQQQQRQLDPRPHQRMSAQGQPQRRPPTQEQSQRHLPPQGRLQQHPPPQGQPQRHLPAQGQPQRRPNSQSKPQQHPLSHEQAQRHMPHGQPQRHLPAQGHPPSRVLQEIPRPMPNSQHYQKGVSPPLQKSSQPSQPQRTDTRLGRNAHSQPQQRHAPPQSQQEHGPPQQRHASLQSRRRENRSPQKRENTPARQQRSSAPQKYEVHRTSYGLIIPIPPKESVKPTPAVTQPKKAPGQHQTVHPSTPQIPRPVGPQPQQRPASARTPGRAIPPGPQPMLPAPRPAKPANKEMLASNPSREAPNLSEIQKPSHKVQKDPPQRSPDHPRPLAQPNATKKHEQSAPAPMIVTAKTKASPQMPFQPEILDPADLGDPVLATPPPPQGAPPADTLLPEGSQDPLEGVFDEDGNFIEYPTVTREEQIELYKAGEYTKEQWDAVQYVESECAATTVLLGQFKSLKEMEKGPERDRLELETLKKAKKAAAAVYTDFLEEPQEESGRVAQKLPAKDPGVSKGPEAQGAKRKIGELEAILPGPEAKRIRKGEAKADAHAKGDGETKRMKKKDSRKRERETEGGDREAKKRRVRGHDAGTIMNSRGHMGEQKPIKDKAMDPGRGH